MVGRTQHFLASTQNTSQSTDALIATITDQVYELKLANSHYECAADSVAGFRTSRDEMIKEMRIPGQVVHPFRSKSSTDSDSSRPVIPIEAVQRFRREAVHFWGGVGIGGRDVGIASLKGS